MKYFSWENSIFKAEKSDGTYTYVTFVIFYSLDTTSDQSLLTPYES